MPPKKKAEPKTAAVPNLSNVLKELQEGGLSVDGNVPEPTFYSTGNMAIDLGTGGGMPVGKIAMFAGPQASGKTTTAIKIAAGIIQEGGKVAFFDFERAMDKPYFRALGVEPDDKEHFYYFAPRTLEQGANAIRKLVATGEFRLVIVDSVARLITQSELDADTGTVTVMDKAKMLYQFHRQVIDLLADNDCSLIWLNHLLEKVDMTWAGKQKASMGIKEYTTPGGNAIPFFASLILHFDKKGKIEKEELNPLTNTVEKTSIGFLHKVFVQKNKVGRAGGTVEVVNIMGEGFSQDRTAMEILKAYDVVTNQGAWYRVNDEKLIALLGDKQTQGEEGMFKKIFSNPEARGVAISLARRLLTETLDNEAVVEDDIAVTDQYENEESPLLEGSGVFSGK